jgi:hypothetical protein
VAGLGFVLYWQLEINPRQVNYQSNIPVWGAMVRAPPNQHYLFNSNAGLSIITLFFDGDK